MTEFSNYAKFVESKTSKPSTSFPELMNRLHELYSVGMPVQRLMTASDGMTAEAGEFKEIIKKILYQGKPWNEDQKFHLKREMGDLLFYFMHACMALNITIEEVAQMNIDKLEGRYPNGFEVVKSEIRKANDI